MKKIIPFAFLFATLLLTSCQKEYGYYSSSRLKVVVDLTDAVNRLDEQNEGDFELDKDHAVRVQLFLYDASGNLYADQCDYVDGYYHTKVYRFENVPLGEYTLIAATDVVERMGSGKSNYAEAYWNFDGLNHLATFMVRGLDQMDVMGERLLTLTEAGIAITGRSTSQRVSIDVEPVTAMVCSTFLDVFYWDKNPIKGERRIYNYFDLSYKHDYNVVTYNPTRKGYPWEFSESTTEFDYYLLDRIYPDKLKSNVKNIYGYHAVLPGNYGFTGYGEYTVGSDENVYSDQTRTSGTVRMEAGGMYYVDFDIKEWEVNLEGAAYTRANPQERTRNEVHGSDVRHRSLQRDSQ